MRLSVTARIALLSIGLALGSNLAVLAFVRHHAQAGTLERALVVGLFLALVCGAAGGWIVSRYVAQRLGRISRVIEASTEPGSASMPVPSGWLSVESIL